MAAPAPFAAIVVIRSQAGKGGDLFAAEAAQLRQADQERECGPQADALDGDEQGEAAGEFGVPCDTLCDQQHAGLAALVQPGDVLLVQALESRRPGRLGHGLERGDLFLDLLKIGQLGAERIEAGVGQRRQGIEAGGEGGDQHRVELVVLGQLQPAPGEMADLSRLEAGGWHRRCAQMHQQPPFIAARGLEADPPDTVLGQKGVEPLQPGRVVGNRQMPAGGMKSDVELVLCHIDAGANHARIIHLRRPRLGSEPKRSCNHAGLRKKPVAIPLPAAQKASKCSIRQPAAGRVATRPACLNLDDSKHPRRWPEGPDEGRRKG